MAVTPLIKKISNPNGTFIAFQSAINDSNLIGSQQGYRFSFSKYALIKIPDIKKAQLESETNEPIGSPEVQSGVSYKNFVNLDAIGDKFNTGDSSSLGVLSKEFAESFQNYCLNLEAMILTSVDKTASLNANVSEEVFFKWLKETGAMRFEKGETGSTGYVRGTEARFIEPKDEGYDRVVKYINDISAVNVTMDGSVYTEVYIYTPTDHGQSPVVLFTSGDNKFYSTKSGKSYSSKSEYIYGRDQDSQHPDNLSVDAIFDRDMDNDVSGYIFNENTGEWEEGRWYDAFKGNTSTGYYYIDSIGSTKDVDIKKQNASNFTVKYKRSTLDGIKIDWNVQKTYSLLTLGVTDTEISNFTLNEFNTVGSGECKEFDYNAVLLYYDLTDIATGESKSYLYGIYFLNKVIEDNMLATIPCVTKYRSNSLDIIEGNAIGYKINLRTDTSFENLTNIGTSTASRTFSMDLFHESLSAMKKFSDTLNGKITFITNLYNEVDKLRQLFVDDQNKDEILTRIYTLEEEFHNFQNAVLSDSSIDVSFVANMSKYIQDLYKKYSDIMGNKTPVKVEYDYNQYKINSLVTHNQNYNIQPDKYKINIFEEGANYLKLNKFSNYYKHYADKDNDGYSDTIVINEDFNIYIVDSENKWVSGQTFKLVFSSPIIIEGYSQINILTNYDNKYSCNICSIDDIMLTHNSMPIFEIICIDPTNMVFDVNQIK